MAKNEVLICGELENGKLTATTRELLGAGKELAGKLGRLKLGEMEKADHRIVILEAQAGIPYQDYYEVMAVISEASGIVAIVKEDISEE